MMFFGHENMGITFGNVSISAFSPEILRNLGFRCRPSWNPRWRTSTGHHIGFMRFLAPKNGGLATNRTFLSFIVLEVGRFICSEWRPTGGISELGPDLKMILVGYPTHMPSFIISSKSEIFCDYAAWLTWCMRYQNTLIAHAYWYNLTLNEYHMN